MATSALISASQLCRLAVIPSAPDVLHASRAAYAMSPERDFTETICRRLEQQNA